MPQVGQKRCLIACLLKVYELAAPSEFFNLRLSFGTNQSSEPFREQMEQLHERALSIVPSTWKLIVPQWHEPV